MPFLDHNPFLSGLSSFAILLGLSLAPAAVSADGDDLQGVSGLGHPIYLTSMTHMEGDANDFESRPAFLRNVILLDRAMDLADDWEAKLTIESEKPFARANDRWNLNFMEIIVERGHGVGTHCDVGYADFSMTQEDFEIELAANKALVDGLVGSDNNTGCSGAGSELDWVSGLAEAGFEYVDGVVGMHYLAMDELVRPDGYTDGAIRLDGFHHAQVPVDLLDRTYLRTLADAEDLEHDDEDGILILSSGGLGKLQGIAEGNYDSRIDSEEVADPELNKDDVDALVALIRWIDLHRDRGLFSKISIMSHATDWSVENRFAMTYFLKEMQALQDEGIIQWATEKEVVDTYLGR
jgi:hypothetical protein